MAKTKDNYFERLTEIVTMTTEVEDAEKEELVAFLNKQREVLANKAMKAAEANAKKKAAEVDELKEFIKGLLTNEYQSAQAITEHIAGEGVTIGKVRSRLGALVNEGFATKESIKDEESGKSAMCYKLAE